MRLKIKDPKTDIKERLKSKLNKWLFFLGRSFAWISYYKQKLNK